MNIVIVGTAYPLRGGISHFNSLLYEELSRKHSVQIITFKRQYPEFLFPGKTQKETGGELMRVPSEELVDSINPFNWISVGNEINRRKPDLVIFKYWLPFFGPCFGTIARRSKKNGTTKVLYICDNVIPHEKRPGDTAFTRYAFKPANAFIVQSEAVERDLNSFRPGSLYRKIPHPVYNIFGDPIPKQRARTELHLAADRYLLFFGYVRAYKGLDVLLRAMAIARKEIDIRLLVVGEFYDDEQKYRQLIRDLHLESAVTVNADYVPNDMVGRYFSAADAVILPYTSATQSGIAQIAYNFDKPVIATDVGGLGEVVVDGKTGFLVPPNHPESLAASIVRYYRENREQEFAQHVKMEKTKYTWEALADAIEELARNKEVA
ncbi:MAG: glycosyltransferase [Bacteroidota bacterium]